MSYPILTYFGAKIKAARKQRGWEPDELARKIGIPVDELVRMERGTKDVSIVQAQLLAQALDVPITDLL